MPCVSHAFASIYCCLTVTCWERADLLALVGDVYCIFVIFPCGILGQVRYFILSFPDISLLSYLQSLATLLIGSSKRFERITMYILGAFNFLKVRHFFEVCHFLKYGNSMKDDIF